MKLNDYEAFYFDHDKLRKSIKTFLKENELTAEDIAPSIGYADRTLINYLQGANDSRFVAGALCERFEFNPKIFMRNN